MRRPCERERALRAAFSIIVARWTLTQVEVHRLLGGSGRPAGVVVPHQVGLIEHERMTLLVAWEDALSTALGRVRAAEWVRTPSRIWSGAAPIEAMCDLEVLSALARVATGRRSPTWSRRR